MNFELGLIRNHYVGRTFIEPTQNIRSFGVKLKLSPNMSSIKNKSVLNENFQKFFFDKKRKFKFYILEGNSDILNSLNKFLSKHEINSSNILKKQNIKGFDYQKEKNITRTITPNSLVISTDKKKS